MNIQFFPLTELSNNLGLFSSRDKIYSMIQKSIKDKTQKDHGLEHALKFIHLKKSAYNEGVFEIHKDHFDLHITLKGVDKMCFGMKEAPINDYQPEGDYQLLKGEIKDMLEIKEGHAVLIPVNCSHANHLSDNGRKLVVKINRSLWQR
ncbi:YhcH/YjgK/YiaL family protein [Roseivirga pacifica]|uniref:YhcH/YjgK/YiaL family protein n=1 Tax=Roseivirga pacifica TaxID=1267423 RepID=UPI00227A5471|nr:YhcH/YjgK/YiaL family protein [Roseivirga pacifica]